MFVKHLLLQCVIKYHLRYLTLQPFFPYIYKTVFIKIEHLRLK